MNPDKYNEPVTIQCTALELMAVHGNICLGLRHPKNDGSSRVMAVDFLKTAEQKLVECGFLDQTDIEQIHKTENI